MKNIQQRMSELGIVLPAIAAPAGNYLPYILEHNQLWISGQVPFWDGKIKYHGKVGEDVSMSDAVDSARICGLNILAQAQEALGSLEHIQKVVRLNGYVNASSHFTKHPVVINGASDLMVDVFGKAGKHTRVALGAASLPLNSTTEVDAIFSICN